MLGGLAVAALLGLAVAPVGAAEAAPRADSPSAGLAEAYRKAKDPDERFWIVDALRRRVEEKADEAALGALLQAARDPQADVRRRALAALEEVGRLPPEAQTRWREKVAQAAGRGAKDPAPRVREAAEGLLQALKRPVRAPEASPVKEPPLGGRRRLALGAALWAIFVQLAAVLWLRLAHALLKSGPPGSLGFEWVTKTVERNDYVLFPCVAAAALFGFAGAGGALAISRLFAPGSEEASRAFPFILGSALYAFCAMSAFLPAALLARRAGRSSEQAGVIRAAFGSLKDLPAAAIFSALAVVVWPLGLLLSKVEEDERPGLIRWMATAGAPFAAFVLAAKTAAPGKGWWSGLEEAIGSAPERDAEAWLRRPLANGPMVTLFCAAPFLFGLSSVASDWAGSNPTRLLELWFVSDVGFAWLFGVWAGAVAVSIFLAYWLSAAALYAASLERKKA